MARKAEELAVGTKTRKVTITNDVAIKGDDYKKGEVVEFNEHLAAACVCQGKATFVEEAPAKGKKSQ